MTNATTLIAGATGTNGQALLAQFVAHKMPVKAMVRNLERAADLASDYVDLVEGDLAKPETLAAALTGIEKAYIVTAVEKEAPQWFSDFYTAAKAAGVKHIVKFSGMTAAPDSPSEIIRQHYISDQALIESGVTYTIIRPNSFHQNMFWQAEVIKQTGQFYLPMGTAKQSIVDVRDLAEASFNILTQTGHENKIYELTGPEALSYDEIAAQLSQVVGKPVSYIDVPPAVAEQSMIDVGMPTWNAHAVVELQALFATGAAATVSEDLAKLLDRTPISFSEFAQDFAGVFK